MRTLPLAALGVALLAAAPARAQTKIGYVDTARVMNELEDAKAVTARFQKESEKKRKDFGEKRTKFLEARAELEKQADLLSEDARRQKAAELQKREGELGAEYDQLQRDLALLANDLEASLFQRLEAVAAEIAQAEGFSMILQRREGGIVWSEPALDVTSQVIRKYNERFKASSPPAAKAGEPAAKPDAPAAKPDAKPAAPAPKAPEAPKTAAPSSR